jgi:hypothetical protein
MNTIATTYASAATRLSGAAEPSSPGLWNALRHSLHRLSPFAPAVAQARDPVREAAEVRSMADAIRVSDPRFAADLYAAADRHERLYASADGSAL